jgi:hypothetical protein
MKELLQNRFGVPQLKEAEVQRGGVLLEFPFRIILRYCHVIVTIDGVWIRN